MKRAWIAAALLLWATAASAHKASDSYLTLRPDGAALAAQWDVALRDLEQAIGLDADADGAITWGEVRARQDAIAAYALARLQIDGDGGACHSGPAALRIARHSDGAYAALTFAVACPQPPQALRLRYRLFFDFDPQHRGLLRIDPTSGTAAPPAAIATALFTADQPTQDVPLHGGSAWASVLAFWRNGVWHIWGGYDHILFLLALLLPAVLRRRDGVWQPVGLRPAFANTLKVVTAFTVAHSITLSLAAAGLVQVPARLVEAGIAASVVIAALNNAYPLFADGRWLVGFGFGLLHGFGFASVLADPGLPVRSLVTALCGFNAGVESGQLVIVAAFLPLAYLARRSWLYQRLTLVAGSALIAVVASVWFIERTFDLTLL